MLSVKGWISTIVIAGLIVLSGLIHFLIYPLVFLILGSAISKLNPNNKDNSGRNHIQVIANAGVAVIVALLFMITTEEIFVICFVLSFAVALSDTFSSEIGKRYGTTTIDIITFRKIQNGLSGGISGIGTFGGLIGSGLIAIMYYLQLSDMSTSISLFMFGFIGMLIDSILGSKIQAKYIIDNEINEQGNQNQLVKGYHLIDNNVVNFISILLTVLIFFGSKHINISSL